VFWLYPFIDKKIRNRMSLYEILKSITFS